MATVNLPSFTPPDESVPDLLAALIDPNRTLRSVADQFKTSVEALALWMQRPDVAPRLNALSAATAFRARALALDLLPSAIGILRDALDEYADLLRHPKPDPKPHRAQAARRHAADGARRCVGLLSRLARLLPPTISPTPAPRATRPGSEGLVRSTPSYQDAQPHPAPSPAPAAASGRGPLQAQPEAGEDARGGAANPDAQSPLPLDAEAERALTRSLECGGCAQCAPPSPINHHQPPTTPRAPPNPNPPTTPPPARPSNPQAHPRALARASGP